MDRGQDVEDDIELPNVLSRRDGHVRGRRAPYIWDGVEESTDETDEARQMSGGADWLEREVDPRQRSVGVETQPLTAEQSRRFEWRNDNGASDLAQRGLALSGYRDFHLPFASGRGGFSG